MSKPKCIYQVIEYCDHDGEWTADTIRSYYSRKKAYKYVEERENIIHANTEQIKKCAECEETGNERCYIDEYNFGRCSNNRCQFIDVEVWYKVKKYTMYDGEEESDD